jgi:phage head maturation protease
VHKLIELKLYEVSLVTFPMNEQALVTGVKTVDDEQIGSFRKPLGAPGC